MREAIERHAGYVGERVCEIVSADPHELVWTTVPTAMYPDSSEWRIALTKVDTGTRISQQFRVLRAPRVLAVLYALVDL